MKGIKTQLLGIGIILCGIALSLNSAFGYFFGLFGAALAIAGYLDKENDQSN